MADTTAEQLAQRQRRLDELPDFVAQSRPVLVDFAKLIGIEPPERVIDDPEPVMQRIDRLIAFEDFGALKREDRIWLHTRLMYLVGQRLIRRYGGAWKLDDNPDSRSYLRYVIGDFPGRPSYLVFDAFSIVEDVLKAAPGRSFSAIVAAADAPVLKEGKQP